MNIRLFIFSFFVFIYSFFVGNIYAIEKKDVYFHDDFSGTLNQNWNVFNDGGNISTGSFGLLLSSSTRNYPFLSSNKNIFPVDGNYELKILYSYPNTSNFGVGFGFGNYIPSYGNTSYPEPSDFVRWIYFYAWQSKNDNHVILGRYCQDNIICDPNLTFLYNSSYNSNVHNLNIKFLDDHFVLTLDGSEISNQVLLNSHRRPTDFWIGNPVKLQNLIVWTELNIREITVYKISDVPPEKEKVVILPGFGGSWDVGAVLAGTGGTNWKIPPFVKNYDGIIQSFKNAGYVEGTDLFIFGYDWRKKLTNLADDLDTFINSKGLTKVNLVGHSMGGLVARSYAQKHGTEKVGKILTVGSPHLGLIDMYGLWEGAKIWDGTWWQNALLEIASEVNRNPGETKVASLRRSSPSIIDLFPTFPFLFFEGSFKNVDTMVQRNLYLKSLDDSLGSLGSILTPFWSEDISQTRNGINISDRAENDILLGRWEDGRPFSSDTFKNTAGDGTVTKESAVGPFGPGEKMVGWHGDLLANLDNNKMILSKLGLNPDFASASGATDNRKNSFVALLRSPGRLEVCNDTESLCDEALGGIYFETEKLFILPGYSQENLKIKVKEDGLGDYKLYIGNIDETPDWQERNGKLTEADEVDEYFVSSDGENITTKQENTIFFGSLDDKVFGDSDFVVSATASSELSVSFAASGNCLININTVQLTGAGSCTVTASQPGDGAFFPAADVAQTFTINKTQLIVTANDKTRQFSDKNPKLTYTVSQASGYSGTPVCTTTANNNSPAGIYPISCQKGSLASTNYDFTFVDGSMKVEKENAETVYLGDIIGFTWGRNKTTNINLRALVLQEMDKYLGDLRLAKVKFEVISKDGTIVSTNKVAVDRYGFVGARVSGLRPGDYTIRLSIDRDNNYWRSGTKSIKLKIYSL